MSIEIVTPEVVEEPDPQASPFTDMTDRELLLYLCEKVAQLDALVADMQKSPMVSGLLSGKTSPFGLLGKLF